jgi:hypothetical protein
MEKQILDFRCDAQILVAGECETRCENLVGRRSADHF